MRALDFQTRFTGLEEDETSEVFFQRYGRQPREVRNNGSIARSIHCIWFEEPNNRKNVLSFDETRKRNICFKCNGPLKLGRRCKRGSVIQNARKRLGNSEYQIYIVRHLLIGLKYDI